MCVSCVYRIKEKGKEQGEGEAGIKRAEHQRIPDGDEGEHQLLLIL